MHPRECVFHTFCSLLNISHTSVYILRQRALVKEQLITIRKFNGIYSHYYQYFCCVSYNQWVKFWLIFKQKDPQQFKLTLLFLFFKKLKISLLSACNTVCVWLFYYFLLSLSVCIFVICSFVWVIYCIAFSNHIHIESLLR